MNRLIKNPELQKIKTSSENSSILCFYRNTTDKIQIAKISNLKSLYFEQVIFPAETILFNAFPEAELEIYAGSMLSGVLIEKIPCSRLRVNG